MLRIAFDVGCLLTALVFMAYIWQMLYESLQAKNKAQQRLMDWLLATPPPPPHPSEGPEASAAWNKAWREYKAKYPTP